MKFLLIGGTGIISSSVTRLALSQGHSVTLLNRGARREFEALGAEYITGDIYKEGELSRLLAGRSFDVVADFMAFVPEHIQSVIDAIGGRMGQYVFISSASVYQKPLMYPVITESTPLHNPYAKYSSDKIACEEFLTKQYRENGLPMVIVRPSHTYSKNHLPTPFGTDAYSFLERLRQGKRIVVHGDGTSLWTITHADDFAVAFTGLLGNPAASGQAFQITSDEAINWNNIVKALADAVGVTANIVHIPTDVLISLEPELTGALKGDKTECAVFDNTKIKRFVPWYTASIPFYKGIRRALEYMDAHPECKVIDERFGTLQDRLLEKWDSRNF